jgi:radical SAM protein with 4Fe4S-binding SPASM domain
VHCQHYYSQFGQDMEPAIFEKIVTSVLPGVEDVVLNGYGEPFLAKHFDAMFDVCVKHGCKLDITSNGLLLRDPERLKRLGSGFVKLALSLDGACKETFESIRRLMKWEQIVEALECIRNVRADRDIASRLSFCIHFCAMKRNIAELPDVVRLAHKYGACEVTVLPLGGSDSLPEVQNESLADSPELVSPAFMEAVPLAERLGVALHVPSVFRELVSQGKERRKGIGGYPRYYGRRILMGAYSIRKYGLRWMLTSKFGRARRVSATPFGVCRMPWNASYFSCDGTVYPCCFMIDRMGDLNTQSWGEIWNGPLYRGLRRTVHSWNPPKGCRMCPMVDGIHGGDDQAYSRFFGQFHVWEMPIETLTDEFAEGFYDLEYYDGRPFHRWMCGRGKLRLPMREGAKFLRLRISPCPGSASGTCSINQSPPEPFDTSCDTITFPLRHVRDSQVHVSLEMDSTWRLGDDPRELGLPVQGIEYLS